MKLNSDILIDKLQAIFEEETIFPSKGKHDLLKYCGVLNQDLINNIAQCLETKMISAAESKKNIKKMFSILIEGLQNLKIHGLEQLNGNGSFVKVSKDSSSYFIEFGNIVDNSSIIKLESKLNTINDYDLPTLKDVYIQKLSEGIFSEKGGAGLGFLTMRLRSHPSIKFNFIPIDSDFSLFHYFFEIRKT